jgi:uncharacterized protein YndB with AHSA1/START domain
VPTVRRTITIHAPPAAVWDVLVDIARQPEWMHDLKSVEMETAGPLRPGSRGVGTVRMFGISQVDPIEVTEVVPLRRFALRHLGRFTGAATFELSARDRGTATRVHWTEDLRLDPSTVTGPGLLGRLPGMTRTLQALTRAAAPVLDPLFAPVFHVVFRSDLRRLRTLVEEGRQDRGTEPSAPTSGTP